MRYAALLPGSFARELIIAAMVAGLAYPATAADPATPRQAHFASSSVSARTLIMLTGVWGLEAGRGFGTWASKQGFNVVVVDGRDILAPPGTADVDGAANLRKVIDQARERWVGGSKVVLIGFSLGGAGALLHGAQLTTDVAAVVAYVPAVNYVRGDVTRIAPGLLVPTLVLAGEKDDLDGCCKIETIRALEAAARPRLFTLVSYPEAGHMFPFPGTNGYRPDDFRDAWNRTVVFIDAHLPSGK